MKCLKQEINSFKNGHMNFKEISSKKEFLMSTFSKIPTFQEDKQFKFENR